MDRTTWTGASLADLRRSAGVSRAQLAERLGVSVSRIRNAELAASAPDRLRLRVIDALADLTAGRRR